MMTAVWIFSGIIAAFITLMLIINLKVVLQGRKKIGTPVPPLKGKLGKRIAAGDAFCFYFYSPMCSACQHMSPVIDAVQSRYPEQVKSIDIQKEQDIARALGIQATPTTVMVKDGKIVHFIVGVRPESRITALMRSLM